MDVPQEEDEDEDGEEEEGEEEEIPQEAENPGGDPTASSRGRMRSRRTRRPFTEVEVCEKTSSFIISTISKPVPWNKKNHSFNFGGGTMSSNNNGGGAFRRASLAVMASGRSPSSIVLDYRAAPPGG